jgi:hypothetical protein
MAESAIFNWSTFGLYFWKPRSVRMAALVRILWFTLLPFDTDTKGVKYLKRVVLTAFLRLTGAQSPPGTRRTAQLCLVTRLATLADRLRTQNA